MTIAGIAAGSNAQVALRPLGTFTAGTGTALKWRVKHTDPSASVDYRGFASGASASVNEFWGSLAAGSHTWAVEYYLTGTGSPVASYRYATSASDPTTLDEGGGFTVIVSG